VTENVYPYGVEGHRHLPEIRRHLAGDAPVTFVPHLLPLDQGLLASCYVELGEDLDARGLEALYAERYRDEPFVEAVDVPPGVRDVRDTNLCLVHAAALAPRRVAVFAAIDNLWKGAAGQAIQNLNLMLGLAETEGLL
jgi:N-acetyl-gamma-glutamyl-phosphate reductase